MNKPLDSEDSGRSGAPVNGAPKLAKQFPAEPLAGGLAAVLTQERRAITRFLAARCGDADLADDLYQELWLRLLQPRSSDTGDGSANAAAVGPIANPRSYVLRAAHNLVLDHRRGKVRAMRRDGHWARADDPSGLMPDERSDPAEPADVVLARAQEVALLTEAIGQLPPGAATALRLHRIEGLPHSDVAARMGISRSGVEKHIAVAMKHLRRAVATWADEAPCAISAPANCGADGAAASQQTSPTMVSRS